MLRNKEIRFLLLFLVLVSVAGLTAIALVYPQAVLIAGILVAVLILAVSFFTFWRYRQIERLSDYLKRVNSGNYSLDLRDNDEGELSILKSELYKVTVTLREQNDTLKKEKLQLANALSDISHQLKTPLTSMFVLTDLLCDVSLPDEKRIEFTDRIRSQLERLRWLVSSLLKLSKLDAKTIEFKKQKVLPQELLDKACEPILIPMELKNQKLTVRTDGESLCCDINWTVEALVNILKNCVEHTQENGEIDIACVSNPLFTKITITDSGAGIDKADLPFIFERFYKGKNAGDDSVGIGLAMASTIITEQGGRIDVRNGKQGAEFVITLK